ncbi:hypothetical protein ACRE_059790 [Hapsidospora chrysogenum ATCC 11550]|uniref:Uncharacterized protein n=1 Tax=Hapsidospora chrysogenum (strain ATCC 11550 / CBS 779.69 / DSM 880 / IAM 14645 / JCM 23072 / IMI 49137) TaxID=857340 RepID=A0A086T1P4_HAPC1|nr:hypothetical protein ACRE_059790 [Hapsidospora chrysogenum ATCC 11550]
MGQAISAARSAIKEGDEAAKVKAKQDLDVLAKALDSQLNEFEAKLDAKFLNPTSTEKTEIPGNRVLRKLRFANVKVKGRNISGAVDEFFSIGNTGVDTKGAVLGGFKKIVSGALDAFMGNTDVGQHKVEKYFIYMQHNAVVRLDVMGFSDNCETAFGYVVCTSIVDVAVLKTSEFAFLISEYAGLDTCLTTDLAGDDEDEVVKYTAKMEKIYDAARRMKLNQGRNERPEIVDHEPTRMLD